MASNEKKRAYLELLRAGLWGKEARLSEFKDVDYAVIMQTAEEQSVVGLITAGLEYVTDVKIPQADVLQFIGSTMQIEQRNKAMNAFIADLMTKLCTADLYALLVKGQGIAQCYEKPLWRTSGDVDLLLDADDYEKAKSLLLPLASFIEKEDSKRKHLGLTIGVWMVELHGTLRSKQLPRLNKVVDEVQNNVFQNKKVRIWKNGEANVLLPAPNEDVLFVFSHIIQHFWGEGIGLRQICDWSRLLWTYRNEIDVELLEKRIQRADLMTEWNVFASLAVDYLGMPVDAMPFYDIRYKKKGTLLLKFVQETGNFGHNRDVSYRKGNVISRKAISLWRYSVDTFKRFRMFPMDSLKAWGRMVVRGL